ncbi:AP2 domain-containing protein [Akkermansiaceae bacterium]|nr:AP2 domain-containing protein [Akkermansiaceae bacterium]
MAGTDDRYAIARIDLPSASTHGWQVRLQRRGVKYAKYFGDRVYGNPEEALRAAKGWRDSLLKRIDDCDQARICNRSARNRSGVVGVSLVTVLTNGSEYLFWQATWSPEAGKRRCVKFSVMRYGDREAFRLAVEAREDGVSR